MREDARKIDEEVGSTASASTAQTPPASLSAPTVERPGIWVDWPWPRQARAWPRFWARSLDFTLATALAGPIVGAVIGFASPAMLSSWLFQSIEGATLLGVLLGPVAMCIDAAWTRAFKVTPGKFLQGIRVQSLDDSALTFARLAERNLHLLRSGLGLAIPLVSLISLHRSFGRSIRVEWQPWDNATLTRSTDIGVTRLRTWVTATTFLAFLIASGLYAGGGGG